MEYDWDNLYVDIISFVPAPQMVASIYMQTSFPEFLLLKPLVIHMICIKNRI